MLYMVCELGFDARNDSAEVKCQKKITQTYGYFVSIQNVVC